MITDADRELGKDIWAQIVEYADIYTPQSGAEGIAKIIAEKREQSTAIVTNQKAPSDA